MESNSKSESARRVIENIWKRSRINAFAHKIAAESHSKKATWLFTSGLISSVLSILFVILVYLFNSSDMEAAQKLTTSLGIDQQIATLFFALCSIIFTLISVVLNVIGNTRKFEVKSTEHSFFCNSYQYIAQRAREANWPDKPYEEILELLKDLERDFQLLKARGIEPSDSHFDKATNIFKKIRSDEETKSAQSFNNFNKLDP